MSDSSITKIDYGMQIVVVDLDEVQCLEYSEREYIKVIFRNQVVSFVEYDQYEEDDENILREIYLDLFTKLKNYRDEEKERNRQSLQYMYG